MCNATRLSLCLLREWTTFNDEYISPPTILITVNYFVPPETQSHLTKKFSKCCCIIPVWLNHQKSIQLQPRPRETQPKHQGKLKTWWEEGHKWTAWRFPKRHTNFSELTFRVVAACDARERQQATTVNETVTVAMKKVKMSMKTWYKKMQFKW